LPFDFFAAGAARLTLTMGSLVQSEKMNDGSFIFYARKQRERKRKTRPIQESF
jgi:hypothetical protein